MLPALSFSWFDTFNPLEGALYDKDDLIQIKRIMNKAPRSTASDLVDTVPLIHGKKCGRGQYTYKNGDRYEGDWVDVKRHGHGVYYFANGSHNEGEWVEDVEVTAVRCVTQVEGVEVTAVRRVTHSSEPHQTQVQCQCGNFCSIS